MQATLEDLARQVSLSRISVQLLPRLAEASATGDRIPFAWIARLQPLSTSVGVAPRGLQIDPGADFAVFAQGRRFSAESFDGVRLRLGAVANQPLGDAGFWQQALIHHLGPRYRRAESIAIGDFVGVSFTSKDARPFVFSVALQARAGWIYVAEAFFPDQATWEAHWQNVAEALRETQL